MRRNSFDGDKSSPQHVDDNDNDDDNNNNNYPQQNGYDAADAASLADSSVGNQQQQQQQLPPNHSASLSHSHPAPLPHPSAAFARPSTSQASLQSSPLDPNDPEELRNEIKRLRLAMIDQFGGKHRKSVGGSQFRVRQPAPDSGAQSAEVNGLRVAVKNLRSELKSLKLDYEDSEQASEENRAARRLVEEQLRKENQDTKNLKSELDRLRALLETTQSTVKVIKQKVPVEAPVQSNPNDANMLSIMEARLREEKKQSEILRESKKQTQQNLKSTTEELKETEQR